MKLVDPDFEKPLCMTFATQRDATLLRNNIYPLLNICSYRQVLK